MLTDAIASTVFHVPILLMTQIPDLDWGSLATGVGGFGALRLVEGIVRVMVGRLRDRDEARGKSEERSANDRRAQDVAEAAIRDELRRQITGLYERCDILTTRLDRSGDRILALVGEVASVKAENHRILAQSEMIRSENHEMRNYMTILIVRAQRYHKLLGLPPEESPSVPAWLLEPKPAEPKPPEANASVDVEK